MFPLRDNIPSRTYPFVTKVLIIANVVVFLYELTLGRQLGLWLTEWALIPVRYTHWGIARHFTLGEQLLPFLSSMFLHGGWVHLIGNLWTLWIFGDNVEDRLGHARFLGFYLLSGVAAALLHVVTNPSSHVPTIGASGAIAGVMGAYLRFFPRARVATIIPPLFLGPVFELPAVLFLGWWFFLQFFQGALSLAADRGHFGGVAWWAHIGGFVFGLWMARKQSRRACRDEASGW
jgi:hypothetical protein